METLWQRSFRINRPKCLDLKYPIVASYLIAAEVMTEKEHENIKSKAQENVDRMDELMGFLYKCNSKVAFDAVVDGVRECFHEAFAEKLEHDCKVLQLFAPDAQENEDFSHPNTPENITIDDEDEDNEEEHHGAPCPSPVSPAVVSVSSSIFEIEIDPETIASQIFDDQDDEQVDHDQQQQPSSSTILSPRHFSLSSSSSSDETPQTSQKSQSQALIPAGSHFTFYSQSRSPGRADAPSVILRMNFRQVLTRQIYGRGDFYFRNPRAVIDNIILTPNSYLGLTYKGCGADTGTHNRRLCTRRVREIEEESGTMVYTCDSGHKTNWFVPIPRLKVTFKDRTDLFPLTLFRQNVEILLDMNTQDMSALDVPGLNARFEIAKTKVWNLEEVICEKVTRAKVPWNNCANKISQAPPTKHKRAHQSRSSKRRRI